MRIISICRELDIKTNSKKVLCLKEEKKAEEKIVKIFRFEKNVRKIPKLLNRENKDCAIFNKQETVSKLGQI
jgi:hypothetical protein